MKKILRIATIIVTFTLIFAAAAMPLCVGAAGFNPTSTINLADGVTLQTQVTTDTSLISAGQRINLLTVDLSKPNITMEMVLNRNAANTLRSVKAVMNEYNTSMSSSKRPIAGVNADWFHAVGSAANYAGLNCDLSIGSTYSLPFGCDIVNGEIMCSQYSYAEWLFGGAIPPMVFGITSDNKAIVGEPKIVPTIKNTTRATSVKADGINRAPVKNSVMVYNNALRDTYYPSSDSLEIVVEITSGTNKFYTAGTKITGKIVSISKPGTAKTTKLTSKNIIINAKCNETEYTNKTGAHSNGLAVYSSYCAFHPLSTVKTNYNKLSAYSVGDTIEITTSISDAYGTQGVSNSDWRKCQFAAGGNFTILKNGVGINENALAGDSSYYPSTMIGTDQNGKVLIANCTKDANGKTGVGVSRQGTRMNEMTKYAKALGFYNCFLFDGGGSATMITATSKTNGTLVDRGNYDDGQIRSVFNSFVVFYDANKSVATATPKVTHTPTAKPTPTKAPTAKVTSAPVTKAPATKAPATNAPVTKAPATNVPITNAPVTKAPATNVPETNVPATNVPATDEPAKVTETPVNETEAPANPTAAPADVTAAPQNETPAPDDDINSGSSWILIAGIIAAIVEIIIIGVIVIIVKKKKAKG